MHEENNICNHSSLRILRFFLRYLGMWPTNNPRDQLFYTMILYSLIFVVIGGFMISLFELYYTIDDLQKVSFSALSSITAGIEVIKVCKSFINRNDFVNFNAYTEKIFWKKLYDTTESQILKECNSKSIRVIIINIIVTQLLAFLYVSTPIFESIGKNSSDRALPIDIHINLPFSETPYYQLGLAMEGFSSVGMAICCSTYSGFLSITNFYAAGQFKILQNKLELAVHNVKHNNIDNTIIKVMMNRNNINLKDCIKQHQILIFYMEKVESLFNIVIFSQTLGSIALLCFCSFQLLLSVETSILRILLSTQFLLCSLVQLFLFAWSCHNIMIESSEVAEAAYRSYWYNLSDIIDGKSSRQLLRIILVRARKPCILTVGKFTPMSFQTFSSVINTAISYFTVLRQMKEDIE